MFPAGNIPLGAREDRCPARRRTIERSSFRRAEGWIARRGDFLLPAFVCFFGAFFAQAKKAEFPKLKKAQEKILQIRRFAGDGQCEGNGLPQPLAGLRNDDRRECISARRKTSFVGFADTCLACGLGHAAALTAHRFGTPKGKARACANPQICRRRATQAMHICAEKERFFGRFSYISFSAMSFS